MSDNNEKPAEQPPSDQAAKDSQLGMNTPSLDAQPANVQAPTEKVQHLQVPDGQTGQETHQHDDGKQKNGSTTHQGTGFDAVVREERKNRKLTFGPNSKKVTKPSNILIDIYGVICSWDFAQVLREYAKTNLGNHVKENWNDKTMKAMMARMRDQVETDRRAGFPVPAIAPETALDSEQKDTAAASVIWQMEKKHASTKDLISRMCTDLWSKSYDSGRLKTHAYPEVAEAFNYWRFEEFIKIYSYASGAAEGQRQFLRASEQGDLNRFIANALNASGGYKLQADKFKSVASALREPNLKNLLYITDSPEKAKNAIQAGLRALVVNRDNKCTGKFSPENTHGLIVVTNLADIQFIDDPNNVVPMNCC